MENTTRIIMEYASRVPDFLCIGAQKAGTTWLHSVLSSHPSVWMPQVKELQYFNEVHIPDHRSWTRTHRESHSASELRSYLASVHPEGQIQWAKVGELVLSTSEAINDDWYKSIFGFAPYASLVGEATPEYSILPQEGIRHIFKMNPELKLIFMVRDPIYRAWSHIRMLLSQYSKGSHLDDSRAFAKLPDVLLRSDYGRCLRNYISYFDLQNVIIVNFDEIATAPQAAAESVCNFLGVEAADLNSVLLNEKIHAGERFELHKEIYDLLRAELAHVYTDVPDVLVEPMSKWRAEHYA